MNNDPSMSINEVDKIMHPVEKQWHYPILTKYGFTSDTESQQGLVRGYIYTHPDGHTIHVITGYHSDYWSGAGGGGYWSSLELHLQKLTKPTILKLSGKMVTIDLTEEDEFGEKPGPRIAT